MKKITTPVILLAVTLLLSPAIRAEEAEKPCPCKEIYEIDRAKIAFMGRLEEIVQDEEYQAGFQTRVMQLTFKIEEPWRGVPVKGQMVLKTDDTSCGYGFQLAPTGEESKIGQSFAIFAEKDEYLSICNSVIMHRSLLNRMNKKFLYFEEAADE